MAAPLRSGIRSAAPAARLIATLLNDLETLDKRLGMATLCVGGGQGVATIIERLGRRFTAEEWHRTSSASC